MSEDGKKYLSDDLQKLIEDQEGARWLNVEDLQKGDVLKIKTKNSLYEMKLIDPEKHRVMVTSDSEAAPIKDPQPGSMLGSTLTGTGTMLKMGRIGKGYRICLWVEGKGELILTPTEKVFINDDEVMM
jgi:hypothetical protein